MRKVWNTEKRAYEFVAEGLYVDGIDYDFDKAWQKWRDRGGQGKCGSRLGKRLIRDMIANAASFDKHHHWLEAMEQKILEANAADVQAHRGRSNNGLKPFVQIPQKYRAGILAIANGNTGAYDRGSHSTCPAAQTGGFGSYREYHLKASDKDGRATTATKGGKTYIYYSTTHAHSTYDYYLVTMPVTISVGGQSLTETVPLHGGNRDGLLTLPTI